MGTIYFFLFLVVTYNMVYCSIINACAKEIEPKYKNGPLEPLIKAWNFFPIIPDEYKPNKDEIIKESENKFTIICWTHVLKVETDKNGTVLNKVSSYKISFKVPEKIPQNFVKKFGVITPTIEEIETDVSIIKKTKIVTCSPRENDNKEDCDDSFEIDNENSTENNLIKLISDEEVPDEDTNKSNLKRFINDKKPLIKPNNKKEFRNLINKILVDSKPKKPYYNNKKIDENNSQDQNVTPNIISTTEIPEKSTKTSAEKLSTTLTESTEMSSVSDISEIDLESLLHILDDENCQTTETNNNNSESNDVSTENIAYRKLTPQNFDPPESEDLENIIERISEVYESSVNENTFYETTTLNEEENGDSTDKSETGNISEETTIKLLDYETTTDNNNLDSLIHLIENVINDLQSPEVIKNLQLLKDMNTTTNSSNEEPSEISAEIMKLIKEIKVEIQNEIIENNSTTNNNYLSTETTSKIASNSSESIEERVNTFNETTTSQSSEIDSIQNQLNDTSNETTNDDSIQTETTFNVSDIEEIAEDILSLLKDADENLTDAINKDEINFFNKYNYVVNNLLETTTNFDKTRSDFSEEVNNNSTTETPIKNKFNNIKELTEKLIEDLWEIKNNGTTTTPFYEEITENITEISTNLNEFETSSYENIKSTESNYNSSEISHISSESLGERINQLNVEITEDYEEDYLEDDPNFRGIPIKLIDDKTEKTCWYKSRIIKYGSCPSLENIPRIQLLEHPDYTTLKNIEIIPENYPDFNIVAQDENHCYLLNKNFYLKCESNSESPEERKLIITTTQSPETYSPFPEISTTTEFIPIVQYESVAGKKYCLMMTESIKFRKVNCPENSETLPRLTHPEEFKVVCRQVMRNREEAFNILKVLNIIQ